MKKLAYLITLTILSANVMAQDTGQTMTNQTNLTTANGTASTDVNGVTTQNNVESEVGNLDQFGFGPALFVISYDEEVLKDSKDVRTRGDGSISASGSEYSTAFGVEVHYSFAFRYKCRVDGLETQDKCKDHDNGISSGHSLSPFLGLYDLDNGINGIAAGVVYGYWRGDNLYKNRTSLNVGIGWTVHKDQLVLADGLKEGEAVPAGLVAEDYTERKDVEGVILMISASVGF